jgi:hypothetical protein
MLEAIAAAKERKFSFGAHDCCLFSATVADAISDGDYVKRLLEQFNYLSEADVIAILQAGGGLQQLVTDFIGEPIPVGQAMAGDVVLIRDIEEKEVLGVCEGSQVLCATDKGVIPFKMSRAICAWRIG